MAKITQKMVIPNDLLTQLRKLAPKRRLSYGESLAVARLQAGWTRKMLGVTETAMPLEWVATLPQLELEVVPAHRMGEHTSGLTTRRNGRYLIQVNRNNAQVRRRFTLAHELKHVLDYPYARTLHAGLGSGDADRQAQQIERLCDQYAVHLLMPASLVKRAWVQGFQTVSLLAALFRVSEEAMRIRLTTLGLTDEEDRPVATYFRAYVCDDADMIVAC
ncbi:ImmA/IrrE family metallo-endopeptidase [Amycolatopsis sp. cmx-4-68]|uniref:ImmA/IrrE family metallo-endopeptidase n=1 Tax=Amycolatopsis sp. cmx-4-68 TaxID=2790938 RepID=UPI00397E78FE